LKCIRTVRVEKAEESTATKHNTATIIDICQTAAAIVHLISQLPVNRVDFSINKKYSMTVESYLVHKLM